MTDVAAFVTRAVFRDRLVSRPVKITFKRNVMRCLSVRLFVTFVDHVKTNKHIFEIFSLSGSHTILVFPYQTGCDIPTGTPITGASNAGGV